MLVFQALFTGVDASMGLKSVSLPSAVKAGDVITSAFVLISTNVAFPVGSDVITNFYNPVSGLLSGTALLMNGYDFTGTTIVATFQRL